MIREIFLSLKGIKNIFLIFFVNGEKTSKKYFLNKLKKINRQKVVNKKVKMI